MFFANHDDRIPITASPGKMLAMRGLRELRFAGAALET
jgi:hypothetical protein